MKSSLSGIFGVALLGAVSAAAPASAVSMTFDFFADEFTGINNPNGQLQNPNGQVSGSFTVDDLNNNGVVEANEFVAFDFVSSGFTTLGLNGAPLLNFSGDDSTFTAILGGSLLTPLAAGLSWTGVQFSGQGSVEAAAIGLTPDQGELFVRELDPVLGFLGSSAIDVSGVSVTEASEFGAVPLPASGVLLLGAVLATGAALRRKG